MRFKAQSSNCSLKLSCVHAYCMQMLHKAHWLNTGCGKGEPCDNSDSLFHTQATKGQQYLIPNRCIIKTWQKI